ncbi:MAG: class I SAM-dependent methyltransferase [Bacteroidetes bacterium]|nr:class I SAM-dependent methyltransferase [Bacteroidota bacterium]
MYKKSAEFYDALYHFKNYKEASEKLRNIIYRFNPKAKTLLDTACGTGKHIEYLREYFDAEGLDINEDLLNIAKQRCPEILFHLQSMIDFDLRKKYDVVTCLFSSIAYVKSVDNLFSAVSCMAEHLNPGGLLIIEPWFSRDTFWTDIVTVNHYDGKDLKITWMYTPKAENDLSILEINYLVGTPAEVTYFKERHELGLFDDSQYRSAMEKTGLKIEYDKYGLFGRGMYIGIKN